MPRFSRTPENWFLADNATVCGDVTLGELCSVWFTAVVRGDVAPIVLGRRVNVQDGAVIHCDSGLPNIIGNDVTIGHRAVVHGGSVGDGTLIGMGSVVLSRSQIGRECLIAAGAVVPPGMQVPDRMLVAGVPGKVLREVTEKDLEYMRWLTTHYVGLAERYTIEDDVRPRNP
ncbi:gamma carbonic anhydrase family protein [Humisphaera borealis]|uniref:Gamma carbonic anhydrase family protein n=1 Tax=Humisphaera borealis TaxID=2807512 RepID=A0A7M2WXB4_9BACT|nr:gamma carbonic anhydrase family protein [Humisphaera borealis]QOV90167.1 gamma carbonic anhydrase family protein [Humisphaera borealis]